jgi:hypothetical protein
MYEQLGITIVRKFKDFDRWLGHVVQGRSKRHQLWLGKPGKGKTARIHRAVKNSVGSDLFPDLTGRVMAPIYGGRVTPAKWYIRGWQHRLEPLLVLNDVDIRRMDTAWESLLCQFLESSGSRTIRWDLKSGASIDAVDHDSIARYLRKMGLLDEFLREQAESMPNRSEGDQAWTYCDTPSELNLYGSSHEGEDGTAEPTADRAPVRLVLPRSYETGTTVVLVANDLGHGTRGRIFSRLQTFEFDPLVDEQIDDIRTWFPPVPQAILAVIQACHRRSEVLNLDYRAVLNAAESLRLGENWEDPLRASFYATSNFHVQEDASNIIDWLVNQRVRPGQEFTERQMYESVGSLRGERNTARRSAALDLLVEEGWVERFRPPTALRPGKRGRRPGRSFRVLHLPKN